MRLLRGYGSACGALLLLMAGLSCSSSTGPDGPVLSLHLSTITSAQASIVADGSSTTAITVTLKDSDGAPATGTIGSLMLSTSAGAVSTLTDHGNGTWTATLTSSTVAGMAVVTATHDGASLAGKAEVAFVAGPAAAASVANIASNGQTGTVGKPVPNPPSVKVADVHGNGVEGVTVSFAVTGGGGSVSGATQTTNAGGVATVGGWTLGSVAGPNALTATVSVPAADGEAFAPGDIAVTFSATALADLASAILLNAGDGQTAIAGSAVATAPSVKVVDAANNPVSAVSVTFSVGTGGGSLTGATATTNAAGIATVGSWTLGNIAGSNSITASTPGVSGLVTITATGVAGPPAFIDLANAASASQSAAAGTAVALPPAVRVVDQRGNAVSAVAVTFTVMSGGGSITGGNAVTGNDGVASVGSWTLGPSAGANTLAAASGSLTGSPVTFNATGLAGSAGAITIVAGDGQTATAGSAVAVPPSVKVTDVNSNPVAGAVVTFSVLSGGGSVTGATATTSASGVATVGSWKVGNTAGANTLTASVSSLGPVTFTATGISGTAALIAINSGNSQNATVGTAVAVAPSVKVTDTNGNPVAGAGVTFAVSAGGGTITGGTATTNAAGISTVGSWVLGPAAGVNTLTASLSGVGGASVAFNATGVNVPPLNLAVTGRRERGEVVTVVVTQGGSTLSPAGYSLALEPSDGGQINGDGTVKLLKATDLKITATAGLSTGNTTVTVVRPPLVVFDLARDGARHIWQVAIDGGDLQRLTTVGSDNQHGSRVGDKLVYASARSGLDFNIWSMVVSTGVETQLTTAGAADTDPHISNDGSKLTFVTTTGGLARAHHANIDGSGAFPIADNTANTGSIEALPAWSPGSDKVVFSSTSLRGDMDLWLTTTLGGVATRLASPANNASSAELSAAWSSDDRIAFLTNRAGKNEIWITDTDGNPASKLTDGSSPTWLTDGRIVFVRFTGSTGALFWIDPANPNVVHPIDTGTGSAQRPSAVRP